MENFNKHGSMPSYGSGYGEFATGHKPGPQGYETPDFAKRRNSILNRPVKAMSQKNMESVEVQHERDTGNFERVRKKYVTNPQSQGGNLRNAWTEVPDPRPTSASQSYRCPREDTRGTSEYNIINNHDFNAQQEPKEVPLSHYGAVDRGKRKVGSAFVGNYNPLIHQWIIPPADPCAHDREKIIPGWKR